MNKIFKDTKFMESQDILYSELYKGEDYLTSILIGTAIDFQLTEILKILFRKGNTSKRLLGHTGYLGQYQAKADLLYSLQIIEKNLYQDISLIGEIRNAFGHSVEKITFEKGLIHNKVKILHQIQVVGGTPAEKSKELFIANGQFALIKLKKVEVSNGTYNKKNEKYDS